jgi:POT family proton-dependent oligopeptide transporter
MQLGFVFVLLTPLLFLACNYVADTGKTDWGWIVAFFFTITVAEVLISPVGLELAFVAAPKSMKGFITACFLLTIFFGSMLNAAVTPLYSWKLENGERLCTPAQYFGVQAVVAAVCMVAFYFVAKPFNKKLAQAAVAEPGK